MASLNIAEWSAEQVAEWMAGLGPKVAQYVPELHKQGLNGAKLLTLRCDDLEYLGIHIIGHQELLLEAVDHLRNFHYEISRECVQQLALRVSSAAASLARALQHHPDARLETHSLADVARTVHAVKPLVCWLDRWPLCSGSPLAERKAALLKLSLEAATCAQRDRFAEQPARAVAAAARVVHTVADYIIQDVSDPMILQPASLDTVSLKQGEKPLGFEVVPSFCGHHQLAHIRFASPAHASGLVHEADEIVQVGGKCVIGWSGEAVERLCIESARSTGELQLRLRRRGARALPALPTPPLRAPRPRAARLRLPPAPLHAHLRLRYDLDFPRAELTPTAKIAQTETTVENPRAESPHSSSDESEPLSPPASPTQLHLDTARLYPPKPALATARRHSVCGGSPLSKRPPVTIEHFWQELQQRRWDHAGTPDTDDSTLYRRDKAVSCSTGLQLSPRPRTCLGVPRPLASQLVNQPMVTTPTSRGKLDKSHSTPAYDFEQTNEPSSLTNQTIPESPTTPTDSPLPKAGQILDFKKSSTQIEEAIQQRNRKINDDEKDIFTDTKLIEDSKLEIVETVNTVLSESVKVIERVEKERESEESSKMSKTSDDTSSDDIPLPVKYPKPRITERFKPSDVPPEPPPRPSHTQRRQNPVPPPREIPPREHPIPPPRESLFREPYRESLRELSRERDHVIQTWEAISSVPLVRDATARESAVVQHPVLRMIPRQNEARDVSPLKPIRPGDTTQISVPLRHLTKHDIKLISTERRELPPINGDPEPPPVDKPRRDDIVIGAASDQNLADSSPKSGAMSPTGSVVRGIFPSSKSRSLKKKNSILAKRRDVSARSLAARGAAGRVWQRVRARAAAQARWASRHLLLAHNLLYAYRSPDCNRADCMIYLEGFTVCAAGEVKSRAHAFKVYHTGVAFYFACDTRDAMLAWIQLIHRATLLPSLKSTTMELSKQFSETDYSETESDTETSERRSEKEREREKEKEKDKSKFGSLKKLAHRAGRSESHENVSQAATSLDRKYLRFFSRAKPKDDKAAKNKQSGVPVPTEHYRSYRRVTQEVPSTPSSPAPPSISTSSPPPVSKKLPKPINYIHASNPNLLDFEKSDFVTKPAIQAPKPKVHKPDNFIGFVTLEEFMLKKQEEERQQVYTNRVLMGIERDRKEDKKAAKELQKRLDKIVPDVIYGVSSGDLPLPVLEIQSRGLPPAPVNVQSSPVMAREGGKPISVKGKDGYETIVYPEEREEREKRSDRGERDERERRVEAWRASLRRADRVHSGSPHTPSTTASSDSWSSSIGASGGNGVSGASIGVSRLRLMFSGARRELQRQESNRLEQYPHLQCPPTFQPETYSLSRPPRDLPHHPPHRD